MQNDTSNQVSFNPQTRRLREAVLQGEILTTRRTGPLGQIFFCDGCCCGRSEKGFPPLPKAMIKERWKSLKLNGTIQLTISGCLGPCDLANVVYLLASDGTAQWFGGLSEHWHYETFIQWASECHQSNALLRTPAALDGHRFDRFAPVTNVSQECSLDDRTLHKSS